MDAKDVQRLLAAAGYYKGAIDGDVRKITLGAIDALLTRRAGECVSNPAKWPDKRRLVGAGQLVLKHAGYSPGAIDGYAGDLTREALRAWEFVRANGRPEVVAVVPTGHVVASTFPKQSQCAAFYGQPGEAVAKQLVSFAPAYGMRIDWNLGQKVKTISLHRRCAESAEAALAEILAHYGGDRLRALGLDRFAGSYNHRKMRGSSAWSMHAYGCAIDFFAEPNGLRVACPDALFCKPEYLAFFDIWEKHGWVSLGRAIGRDWMHVQAARI